MKLPVSSYFYKGGDEDLGDGNSVLLKVRHDGPGMAIKTANATSTIGTVAADQTAYSKDYGTGFDIALLDGWTIPEYIMEDEPLHIAFQIDYDKRMPRASIVGAHRTHYRFDGEGDWIYCTEGGYRLDGKEDYDVDVRTLLEIIVPAHEVFGHEYIEFYTMSTNNYRSTVTGTYRVDIKKVNEVDGIRTNIDDNQFIKGTVAITANDGTTNANTAIYIDGTKQTTSRMLENGTYLSMYTTGRHSQFYNALTTTKNELIYNTSDWNYLVPDTQYYSEKWPYHYDNIATWISDNIDEWKIKYLMHTGDITDNYDMPWEWERASQSQEILDASGLPYGVLAGNHDLASAQNVADLYWKYFGDHRFEHQPTFGGSYKNNLGHYDLISEHGQDFIIVYMSWNVYQEEIDWMNQVLAQYSDRKAILCFHGYLHVQEEMDGLLDNFGVMIRDQVVAKNPNVFAVLNGHYFGASYQTVRFDDNNDGKLDRTVYQICTDYQSAWEGGEEYIKFFYFDLDNDQVYVNSYSPYFNDFNYYDHELRDLTAQANSPSNGVKWEVDMDSYKFTLDFDTNKQSILENSFSAYLATNEVLGTAPMDEATGTATLSLENLDSNSNYAWYAELNNAQSGYLRTDLYEFTTQDHTEYYLFGYINGANYACEEDYQSMGEYQFDENGNLTVAFQQDSYVAVKEMNNRNWYMAQQYCTGTEATLYNTNTGASEKMFIPANRQVTFTLVNNGDGTLNLSYTLAPCSHDYDAVRTEPSCTEPGSVVSTCRICGDVITEELPATGHGYNAWITAPTCTEAGYTTYTCPCGDSYVADEVAALGHSFADGTCGVCGEADPDYVKPVVIPTLTLKAPALEFKDMITVNAFYTAENIDDVVQMGMITYTEKVDVIDINTAAHVIPGATYEAGSGRYFSSSQGIHSKFLGDTVYLACYAKLTDGTYAYTKLAGYSPITYATNQLKNSTDMNLKQLCAAMLNYGAAAQNYFVYNTDVLANSTLTDEQKQLPEEYRADMVSTVPAADAAKQGIFTNNKGFSLRKPAVSFEGAFSINYFFTPAYAPVDGITLYYWTEADFGAADVLTVDNATGSIAMDGTGTGQYRGDIEGIAAKSLSQAIYVAAVYSDGTTTWTSGVLGYSIGAYCGSLATKGGTIADLAMATAVYGYHAKAYFG